MVALARLGRRGRPCAVSSPAGGRPAAAGRAGRSKIASGGPCSTMRPPSMNRTRSAISRANCISWVTMSMVWRRTATRRSRSSTSPTHSGSRAEVGSSTSISSASSAIARPMPMRCCWPPESAAGIGAAAVGEADLGEDGVGAGIGFGRGSCLHGDQRLGDVFAGRSCWRRARSSGRRRRCGGAGRRMSRRLRVRGIDGDVADGDAARRRGGRGN